MLPVVLTLLTATWAPAAGPEAPAAADAPREGSRAGGSNVQSCWNRLPRPTAARPNLSWSDYRPTRSQPATRSTWERLLAETPAERRTPALLSEAWELTGRTDPCFLYLRVLASARQGDTVAALRAARAFLDEDPARTARVDRDVAEQFWLGVHTSEVDVARTGAADRAARIRGTARLLRLAPEDAARVVDDPLGKRYCDAEPTRCADRPLDLGPEQRTFELPIGVWSVTVEPPFALAGADKDPPAAVELVIRGTPEEAGATHQRPALRVRDLPPPPRPPVTTPPPVVHPPPVTVPDTDTTRRTLVIVELSAGAAAAVAGVVVLGVGARRATDLRARPVDQCDGDGNLGLPHCRDLLARATNLGTGGAAALGAGVGVIIAGALWMKPPRGDAATMQRRIRGGAGIGAGVAAAILGGVALGIGRTRFDMNYGPDSQVSWSEHRPSAVRLHALGGLGLGLGLGLTAVSALNWGVIPRLGPQPSQRLQVAPLRLPGGGGLALSGRF
jgi:hypothetical protein